MRNHWQLQALTSFGAEERAPVLRLTSNGRYEKEFDGVHDVFELQVRSSVVSLMSGACCAVFAFTDLESAQRNLNNAFAYDLVPSPVVIVAALKAARRVNDFPTAVRIFEGGLSLFSWP